MGGTCLVESGEEWLSFRGDGRLGEFKERKAPPCKSGPW